MNTVITQAKIDMANYRGLEIIGQPNQEKTGNKRYLLYKFLDCGHQQNIDTNLVRKGLFKCRKCEDDKLKSEAKQVGLTLLERASKDAEALYLFDSCQHQQRITYSAVRDSAFKCRTCYYGDESVEEKHRREAKEQNLEFIKYSDEDSSKAVYKKISCGHTFEYQVAAVRSLSRGGFKVNCPICIELYYEKLANKLNLKFLSKDGEVVNYIYKLCGHTNSQRLPTLLKSGPLSCKICKLDKLHKTAKSRGLEPTDEKDKYRFIDCGHERVMKPKEINKGEFSCSECRLNRVISVADSFGIEYLGDAKNGDGRYFFGAYRDCGHERDFAKGDITREGKLTVQCPVCVKERHESDAEEAGLTLIGKASNCDPNYRSFIMPCCGSLQDIELTHVRRRSFLCKNCNETFYDKESNVYILTISDGTKSWLKMGIARDLDKRISQYGLHESFTVDKTYVINFDKGYDALKIEKQVHSLMKIFRLDPDDMKNYHTKSGWTECYPVNLLPTLISTMKGLLDE